MAGLAITALPLISAVDYSQVENSTPSIATGIGLTRRVCKHHLANLNAVLWATKGFYQPVHPGGYAVRTIGTTCVLFALWMLMSGLFEPLVVGLGAASVIVTVYVVRRMDALDGDQIAVGLSPLRFARYLVWLMVEIARANWIVSKTILSRDMPIRQHLFTVPSTQKCDLGQVIFANSITLTPGTITVETEGDHFLVHAVSYSSDDPAALAEMDARVTATETGGAG